MVLSCSKTTPSACFRCRKSNAFSIMYVKGPANGNGINKKGSKRPLVEERLVINTMFIIVSFGLPFLVRLSSCLCCHSCL